MKSEERHQLAQNDLQVGLNHWLDRIEPYSNHILGGVVVATLVAVSLILWSRSSAATSDEGWMRISQARTAEQLEQVADQYKGTPAGDWATLSAARMSYTQGIETSLTDRKSSDESLKQARELYDRLLKAKVSPDLREEALKGMGLTLESVSGADVSKAVEAYETLIKEFPNSPFKDYAAFRVADLKNPQASEFYAWFRKQNPKPAARPEPMDGKLPLDGGIKSPALPDLDSKTEPAATSKTETPKSDTTPPLPVVPPAEGKTPPAAPPAAPATEPPAKTDPMPEAPKKNEGVELPSIPKPSSVEPPK